MSKLLINKDDILLDQEKFPDDDVMASLIWEVADVESRCSACSA